MHLQPKRGTLCIAHKTHQMVAFSHSDWDVALIPQLNFRKIDICLTQQCVIFREAYFQRVSILWGRTYPQCDSLAHIYFHLCIQTWNLYI